MVDDDRPVDGEPEAIRTRRIDKDGAALVLDTIADVSVAKD